MEITELQSAYSQHKNVKALSQLLAKSDDNIAIAGLHGSAAAVVFASLCPMQKTMLFVVDDAERAAYFYHDLVQMTKADNALFFPSSFRRGVKHGKRDAANEVLRTDVLTRLSDPDRPPTYIVTYPEALAEYVPSQQSMTQAAIHLHVGYNKALSAIDEQLYEIGFQRRDYVYEPGDYAVRGSLIDVFSYTNELPFRIDFFGDEIDSIRTFDVNTQLSSERLDSATLVPATQALSGSNEPRSSLFDFLPNDAVVVCRSKADVAAQVQKVCDEGFSKAAHAEWEAQGNNTLPDITDLLMNGGCMQSCINKFRQVSVAQKITTTHTSCRSITFDTEPQPITHKNFELTTQLFGQYIANGYSLFILADSEKQTDRLKSIFETFVADDAVKPSETDTHNSLGFTPVKGTIHEGFADNTLKICLFTDHQIFDRFHRYSLRSDKAHTGRVALTLKELQQFKIGDYVVHIDHGVGRFAGLLRLPQPDGTTQEVIKITYAHDDTVLVSIHALHKVSKYKGREGEPPRLSHLGTGAWNRMKERTKSHIKDIARDLIKLYGERSHKKGFAFSPDGFMQHELEASFFYEDTPDQLKTTEEVKRDMESSRPMDRLVCGDVGFGKTEIAVRAAFKAACDGKQVAIMVPTTVLAYQHYHTFTNRLKDMPVRIEYLSRARSASKTKEIITGLADGSINIVIGTHKLLGKTVRFHDLGLLIIDEEQKFGVSTKEKLRQMKTNVDTLTLTATPIPRTLQFSLMGARDLSVIQTPPPNRYPIQTEVHTFNTDIITDAINFEMSRNGQVYIVNNRISGLSELEQLVHRHVPDARIAIGHGKMNPDELEKVILDFANYEYDVLISTSIIESGIDIPNVNTIIINAANHFGLSDLHQMRGRVGRSNKKAFCYLLAPPLNSLPDDARRRLQAIENFAHLGSGIHIAMQDLDIRGAGNLLGAEQSGFIADLGYEAYQKILAEAMRELKNEQCSLNASSAKKQVDDKPSESTEWVDECQIESDLPLFFPESYVPTSSERMLLYRELDNLTDDAQLQRYRARLIDRFGTPPTEAEELMKVSQLKRLGMAFACDRIVLKNNRMRMFFTSDLSSPFYASQNCGNCINYAHTHPLQTVYAEVNQRYIMTIKNVSNVSTATDILSSILQLKV